MKKLAVLFWVIIGLTFNSFAQTEDPVLFQINDYKVNLSEFKEVYRKNNLDMTVAEPKSVEEYLELFINFKLKVLEAKSFGLDTVDSFLRELAGYREQLARPYFYDQQVSERLLQEAYDRLLYDIRASHILISVEEHASAADTLKAWNKIMDIYGRLKNGEPFAEIARNESEDPSARDRAATANRPAFRGNAGDLGYFTVLNMVYAFETSAYNTPVGEISKPVRSPFGYHIIKVTDRLSAMGRAVASHIMVASPLGAPKEEAEKHQQKINDVYAMLLEGKDFGALAAEFSDDRPSAGRQGELPEFTSNRMVPEFIKIISQLEPGEFSQPIQTNFGWHIVKLNRRKTPGAFEEEYFDLRNRVSRDGRSRLGRDVVLARLKGEYNFIENTMAIEPFFNLVDNTIFEAKWDATKAIALDKELFSFAGKSFLQKDFADYLARTQGIRTPENIISYVNNMYFNWLENTLIEFEDSRLEEKYPEFRNVMKEYHDGILLFELTDKLVWSKAVEDTEGLENFFAANRDNYVWDDRLDVVIYTSKDMNTARQAHKEVRKKARRGGSPDFESINGESLTAITVRAGKFEKHEEPVLEHIEWKAGLGKPFDWNGRVAFVHVKQVLPSQPKQLDEIRGQVIADYQNFLEKQWVEQLRTKYNIQINPEVLSQISF
jgi:peptidyl-prolyl cis-trans isomerase SurA